MSLINTEEPVEYDAEKKLRTTEKDWRDFKKIAADFKNQGQAFHRMVEVYKQYGHL